MTNKVREHGFGPLVVASDNQLVLPSYNITPLIGRKPLDEFETDLVLMTKLHRMDVPEDLHVQDPAVAQLLKTTMKEFAGKRGAYELLEVPLPNSRGQLGRHILVVGLGSFQSYSSAVVCNTFQLLIEKALELDARTVTVPFIPNPMTKDSLSHKATAFKLKDVTTRVLQAHRGPTSLREIQLYCTSNAVRHLQDALTAESGPGCCACRTR